MNQLRAIAARAIHHPEEALSELLKFCCKSVGASRAVALAFDTSDSNPRARRVQYISDGAGRAQVLQGSEEFPCNVKELTESTWLAYNDLTRIGEGWLDVFIGGPSLFIPCTGPALGFEETSSLRSGAIVVGPTLPENSFDEVLLEALSIVAGFILLEIDRSKAYATLNKLGISSDVRSRIKGTLTAEYIGQEALALLREVIRYEAGVLYLLDEDPARNEYMVFCASIGESTKHLFNSYYPRERLGITWRAAKLGRPIVGSLDDVPEDARHSNDPGWENVSKPLHAAWALVPLVHLKQSVGIIHLEGVNDGRGLSRREYELLQMLGRTLGEAIFRWRSSKDTSPELYPSVDLVASLYSITDSLGSRNPYEFEQFVHGLFLGTTGISVLTHKSGKLPQSDVVFEVPSLKMRVAVEAKCLATPQKRIGSTEIRQLMAEMNAYGADVGILASCNPLSSRTADVAARGFKIIILDHQRLQRMVALSSVTRGMLINYWLTRAKSEINYLPDVSVETLK